MPKKHTIRPADNPWNDFTNTCEQFKGQLSSMSHQQLDGLLAQAGLDIPPNYKDKIAFLMKEFEFNYKEVFKQRNGFPLEDTRDPKKLTRHFKKNCKQMRRTVRHKTNVQKYWQRVDRIKAAFKRMWPLNSKASSAPDSAPPAN